MSELAIRVESLSKKYRRSVPSGQDRLTEAVAGLTVMGLRWLRGKNSVGVADDANSARGEFWAVQDVSFSVQQGEVIGIIGRNGAGKSTLLKLLSRITEPTRGRFGLRGRVGSLLEVGTGFHPELTGRENVYLNGVFLGMSQREVVRKFDQIAAFAEIEAFLDTPVKRYSSGMYVRLAFSIAAHVEPEILILDEVLAVGDAVFQQKCMRKVQEISSRDGCTVLLVNHNAATVRRLCSRVLWLDRGRLVFDGPAEEGARRYEEDCGVVPASPAGTAEKRSTP
jgi:lipopolysaccharide transport system ATP-binding protein